MSQIVLDAPASEFRHGWSVVLACFCTAVFAWGFGFYGQSVYLAELHHARGWPASLIASATTVYYLTGAVLLTRVHHAITRFGPRLLLSSGAIVLGLGAIGLSRVEAPWQLYACGIVMAAGWAATTTTAIAMTLAFWFDRRRGLALSLALNGASAGGFTVTPLLAGLVHRMGLEQAVLLLVLGLLTILLPILLFGVGQVARDELATSAQDGPASFRMLRSGHFWTVALPFALALAAQVGFIVHQVAFLLPHIGSDGAAVGIAATAIAAAAGRLALAPVIDRVDQRTWHPRQASPRRPPASGSCWRCQISPRPITSAAWCSACRSAMSSRCQR
jgi:MFS family permease